MAITLLLALAFLAPSQDKPLLIQAAKPRPDLDQLFQRTDGWTGGDGVYSVQLAPQRLLWLFSDTWVGPIRDGKHYDATIVNNTLALQSDTTTKPTFVIRRDAAGKPQAWITPQHGKGWFWLFAGAMARDKLLLFLPQIEKTNDKSVFGFRTSALWLGVVDNVTGDPLSWKVTQKPVPHALFTPKRERTFGAAILPASDYLYFYGTDEKPTPLGRSRQLVVARTPIATAADPATWEFFGQGKWHRDVEQCEPIADEMASEASVIHLPERKQYLLVYTRGGMSNEIRGRVSEHPWGPWSKPVTLFRCPEAGWDRRIFCYAAKAHQSLSHGNTVILSYVANSFDFGHMASDARLYWPRFVEVELK
jgi:hypothetical protein